MTAWRCDSCPTAICDLQAKETLWRYTLTLIHQNISMISAYNTTGGIKSIKPEQLSIQFISSKSIFIHSHAQPGASTLTNRPFAIDIPLPLLLVLLPVEPIPNPLIPPSNPQDLSKYRDCGYCPPDLLADDDDETCEIESAGETVSLSQSSSRPLTLSTYFSDPDPDPDPEDPE
jgi:hypothetical protein